MEKFATEDRRENETNMTRRGFLTGSAGLGVALVIGAGSVSAEQSESQMTVPEAIEALKKERADVEDRENATREEKIQIMHDALPYEVGSQNYEFTFNQGMAFLLVIYEVANTAQDHIPKEDRDPDAYWVGMDTDIYEMILGTDLEPDAVKLLSRQAKTINERALREYPELMTDITEEIMRTNGQ